MFLADGVSIMDGCGAYLVLPDNDTKLTEITLEQFKNLVLKTNQKQKIMLTENFGIKVEGNNAKQIVQWFDKEGYNTSTMNGDADEPAVYYVTTTKRLLCDNAPKVPSSVKVFSLNEANGVGKEIIGYKAPMDLFGGLLKKGEKISANRMVAFVKQYYLQGRADSTAIPADIVETWEPVYKEDSCKEIEIGSPSRKCTVYKDKVVVVSGDGEKITFLNSHISELYEIFNIKKGLGGYNTNITSIQVGCSAGTAVSLKDVLAIQKTQSTL